MKLVKRSKTELVYDHNGRTITAKLNTGHYQRRYDIYENGRCVGTVEKSMTSHDRKPRGSRIATTRTHSEWWFYRKLDADAQGQFGRMLKAYNNTVADAIKGIVGW